MSSVRFWTRKQLLRLASATVGSGGLNLLTPGASIVQHLDALLHSCVYAVSVQPVLREQQLGVSMSDEAIGDAHAYEPKFVLQPIFFKQFQDR